MEMITYSLGTCRAGRLRVARSSERLIKFVDARIIHNATEYAFSIGESVFRLVYFDPVSQLSHSPDFLTIASLWNRGIVLEWISNCGGYPLRRNINRLSGIVVQSVG